MALRIDNFFIRHIPYEPIAIIEHVKTNVCQQLSIAQAVIPGMEGDAVGIDGFKDAPGTSLPGKTKVPAGKAGAFSTVGVGALLACATG